MKQLRILLVEDDINMGFLLAEYLEEQNFLVKLCKDGETGLKAWETFAYDICIFDIMLPKLDGFSLTKLVRKQNKDVPIILLTAKGMKEDKINGFNLGVDDYITKPFDEEELYCRIKAILSRTTLNENKEEQKKFEIGNYRFDSVNLSLTHGTKTKRLTRKETEILKMLCLSKNEITRREDLLLSIWERNDYFTGRSLDVFITKLRKYLNDDKKVKIEGIPTVGYVLSDN